MLCWLRRRAQARKRYSNDPASGAVIKSNDKRTNQKTGKLKVRAVSADKGKVRGFKLLA